jgi:hypothetical protein
MSMLRESLQITYILVHFSLSHTEVTTNLGNAPYHVLAETYLQVREEYGVYHLLL